MVLGSVSSFIHIQSSKSFELQVWPSLEVFLLHFAIPFPTFIRFICWRKCFVSRSLEAVFHSQIIFEVLFCLGYFVVPQFFYGCSLPMLYLFLQCVLTFMRNDFSKDVKYFLINFCYIVFFVLLLFGACIS